MNIVSTETYWQSVDGGSSHFKVFQNLKTLRKAHGECNNWFFEKPRHI